jgi:hypothetical protein
MTKLEQDLLDGFNTGYIIEKHQPDIAEHLTKGLEAVEQSFFQAFLAGSREYIREAEIFQDNRNVARKQSKEKNLPTEMGEESPDIEP